MPEAAQVWNWIVGIVMAAFGLFGAVAAYQFRRTQQTIDQHTEVLGAHAGRLTTLEAKDNFNTGRWDRLEAWMLRMETKLDEIRRDHD